MIITKNIRTLRKRLLAVLVIFPLLYLGFKLASITQDYQSTLANAESDAHSYAAALNEHANRTIGEADRLLQQAISEVDLMSRRGSLSDAELHDLVKAYNNKLPQLTGINIVDEKGELRAAGLKFSPDPVRFSDRDYFQHHTAHDHSDLYISRPIISRTSNKWVFTLSRSLKNADGKRKLIFVAGIPLEYFDSFYRSLNVRQSSRIVLIRQDGWILMQSPLAQDFLNTNLSGTPLFKRFRQNSSASYRIEHAAVDGMPRIIGYAGSVKYPMLAVVSLAENGVLEKWRERTLRSTAEAFVTLLLMIGVTTLLLRRLNDLRDAQVSMERQSRSLAKSEHRYQQLVEGIDGVVWEADLATLRFTYVSANAGAITGYPATEWLDNPRFWHDHLAAGDEEVEQTIARKARYGSFALEHHLHTPSGKTVWLFSNVAVTGEPDEEKRLRGVMVDTTERKLAYEELELAAQVFETSLHAVMIFSTDGKILRVNQAFTTITGYSAQEMVGMDAKDYEQRFVHPGHVKEVRESLRASGKWQGEAFMRIKDGREIVIMQSVSVIRDAQGRARSTVAIFHDITGQKDSEQQLYQLAHFDLLTALPNRQTLSDRISRATALAAPRHSTLAVLFIDIDHFKTINDSLGHVTGDQMLREVAGRIVGCLGPHDMVARTGGDEFVVLLEHEGNTIDHFEQVAQQLATTVANPIEVGGKELYVSMSMGISVYPQDGQDAEVLLRNADTAMYRAKAAGRNCWRFFDESMARHAAYRLEIETALRRSIERNELIIYYQPQRSLESGKIVGAEALLRWARPGIGLVPPLDFIPLAEESGLILPIGQWVLRTACAQAALWCKEKNMHLRVAVNIAAKQIHHPDFVNQVRKTLEETGLPPALLELEITESSIVENLDETVSKLRQIKNLGVTVAIDDFGTGYSSLSYLKQLPIDRLKIDRSFVKDTPADSDDCAIVRTIISMSNNLGLYVIAEGVESQAQVDFLASEGCNEIQGYFLSKPVPADELEKRLK
ncbi:MAG: EAL domain-containing protein [Burkholderiales bacterium]|nr:EAL domain-containing protein [Burkholderiales bacterium]